MTICVADRSTSRRRFAYPLLLALAPLAFVCGPLGAGEGPQVAASILWEPYATDGVTTAIFHFDAAQQASVEEILEQDDEEDGAQDLALPGASRAGASRTAANAAALGQPLGLQAGCTEVADAGRFGGGLQFEGGAAIALGTVPKGPRTLEFWVRPDGLPAETTTIAAVKGDSDRSAAIALRLEPDGSLELDWGGKVGTATNAKLAAGEWTHLAVVWGGHRGGDGNPAVLPECRINGVAAVFPHELSPAVGDTATRLAIGNDFDRRSGFKGVVDELRVSRVIRTHFPWLRGWADSNGSLDRPEGHPFFTEPSEPLLRLDFDGSLEPGRAADQNLTFGEGVRRKALFLTPAGAEAATEGRRLVLPDRGTLAFWVRPLQASQPKTAPLFHVVENDAKEPVMALGVLPALLGLHPGRWVHLAVTWTGTRHSWYVDGKPWSNTKAFAWTRRDWDTEEPLRLVFDRPVEKKGEPACGWAIDDFRTYPRPLGRREVRNLASLFDRRVELEPLPAMDMSVAFNGVTGFVDVELQPYHPDTGRAAALELTVVSAKEPSKPLASHSLDLHTDAERRARLDTGPLPFGEFTVRAEARDDEGKRLFAAEQTFTREPPPWWGNRIGLSDKVMPGWEPVRVGKPAAGDDADGATIGVALRDIHFAASGLPERIVAVGKNILAGPVTLVAMAADGRATPLEGVPGAFQVEPRGEARADFTGRAEGGGVAAAVKGSVESDGMMWFDVTLSNNTPTPDTPKRLHGLQLRVPYSADASRLVHWWSGAQGFRNPKVVHIGATPPGEGRIFSSLDTQKVALHGTQRGSFMPYVMLQGDRGGMAWFGENDQGWTHAAETPAVSLERKGDTMTLVLTILGEPAALAPPRTFSFGLHPTPIKPVDSDWRITPFMGMWVDSFEGFNLKGPWGPTDNWRHPENMDWDRANRRYRGELGSVWNADDRVQQSRAAFRGSYGRDPQGREVMPVGLYADLTWINAFPDHTREWGETFDAWRYTPEIDDYWAWLFDQWLKKTPIRGIYVDDCFNDPRDAAPSVSYRRPDGGRQPGFQWRQIREHLRRTRQVFLDNGLRPNLCGHSTHTLFAPYHSFFDTVLDGEDFYKGAGDKRDFMDSWPPERLRFTHPERWGMAVTWLNWFAGPGEGWERFPELRWRQWRAYTAALLVHDQVWTVASHQLDAAWIAKTRLRLDPATAFVGYWDERPIASHHHDRLYVSGWKQDSRCVVALANWGEKPVEAEVALDLRAMGFGDVDAESVTIRDVDTTLITYFDDDPRKIERPKLPDNADLDSAGDLEELTLDAPPTPAERKAADPDAKVTWREGVLRCPVRRHDFRVFEFEAPTTQKKKP